MLASRYFKITRGPGDDWFDTILNADTKLFVDPFLVFKDKSTLWQAAYQNVIKHFDRAFLLIAQGNQKPESLAYQKALHLLGFPEPRELCLGYTAKGSQGAGTGRGFAEAIAEAIVSAIERGLEHPRHFEELGILNQGIGADRISDITCTILKADLIEYTRAVAAKHGIPVSRHRLIAAGFDTQRLRWETRDVEVPTNPFSDRPLLFVPAHFLRELPTLNADDWWDSWENEQLRQDVNYEIMGRVDKATIVATARQHPEAVRAWTTQREHEAADAYDLRSDPRGVWQWDRHAEQFAANNPLQLAATTQTEFVSVIEKVLAHFKLFVEEQGGWKLLWNDNGNEKPEEAAQLLFRGIVQNYCHANNINIDREVELGRGPVDFKFSSGYHERAHLEIKKLHNGQFWHGVKDQLPSYMGSDEVSDGWLVAVWYRNNRTSAERAKDLPAQVIAIGTEKNLALRFGIVDARRPVSASKIR